MKKGIAVVFASLLFAAPSFASWTSSRYITGVQVADACGSVTGQYAVITDSAGVSYWITTGADNFSAVVDMAQRALIYGRTVDLYSRSENYTVQTQRAAGDCHSGGTIANRLSILNIR